MFNKYTIVGFSFGTLRERKASTQPTAYTRRHNRSTNISIRYIRCIRCQYYATIYYTHTKRYISMDIIIPITISPTPHISNDNSENLTLYKSKQLVQ
jgi:hypothetical protein